MAAARRGTSERAARRLSECSQGGRFKASNKASKDSSTETRASSLCQKSAKSLLVCCLVKVRGFEKCKRKR